ncbi:efflux RND transporter periplasmic adaptor subunit [Pseudotenacibaculum sp. MALMAid0570]|uniref:efflux RND transporter periplasmic adaptor subunit n=1 Tax=Pseudotenacibaculum sp. MALMAid0570 TaxID=3143938 RepID=UPI0032DEDDA5
MRKIYSIFIMTLVLVSCGKKETGSLDEVLKSKDTKVIQQKKSELDEEQQKIAAKIKQLNERLDELNPDKNIPLITTFSAKESLFTHYLELQGNVKTRQNVLIYPEMAGLLEKVYVTEGQKVVKGQLLATIDDGGMQQQLAQAEATAELAKTTYERQKRLWDQKIGSEIQYLQSKTDYLAKKNSVEQLKKQLDKSKITAPFNGVIDEVIKDEGTIVAPGQGAEVFRIVNLNNMFIETDVPETYIKNVTKGKQVVINFPILGTTIDSKIRQAGNFINPANRTFRVEIPVPSGSKNVKPNLTARLKINDYTNKNAILIPLSIISENASGQQYVYAVTNQNKKNDATYGTAVQKIIKVGKTQGDNIEVLEGINVGDNIIDAGARSVKNKQEVKIDTEEKK